MRCNFARLLSVLTLFFHVILIFFQPDSKTKLAQLQLSLRYWSTVKFTHLFQQFPLEFYRAQTLELVIETSGTLVFEFFLSRVWAAHGSMRLHWTLWRFVKQTYPILLSNKNTLIDVQGLTSNGPANLCTLSTGQMLAIAVSYLSLCFSLQTRRCAREL